MIATPGATWRAKVGDSWLASLGDNGTCWAWSPMRGHAMSLSRETVRNVRGVCRRWGAPLAIYPVTRKHAAKGAGK